VLPHIHLGPLQVSTYYLTYVIAIVVAGMVAIKRLQTSTVPWYWPVEGMAAVIAGGMVGTAVFWWLLRGVEQLSTGGSRWFSRPGSTVFGAITFGALAGLAYCRWRRVPIGATFDIGIVAMPLGQGIGRLGCFLAGCCYGKPTESWLGMHLPGEDDVWCRRFPTQLYSSLADFAIFGVLILVDRRLGGPEGARAKGLFPGYLALLYGLLYFSKRFLMEFLRAERPLVWGPFTWAHCTSGVGLLLVIALWTLGRTRFRRHAAAIADASSSSCTK
jgi:phosphatidylglycerol:prolipoprotein diacylglycerol transferase